MRVLEPQYSHGGQWEYCDVGTASDRAGSYFYYPTVSMFMPFYNYNAIVFIF